MPSRRELTGFALLFAAYQVPEGVGQRLLHSFPVQAALLVLFFPIAFAVGRWLRRGPLEAYALEWPSGRGVLVGLFAMAIAAKWAAVVIGARFGVYTIEEVTPGASLPAATAAAAAMTFLPSIAEDIVTRGFWFRLAGVGWRPMTFVVVSSAIYVGNHVFRLNLGPFEWMMLFAFGCAYAAALVRTGTLWGAVALHWGWNFANAMQDSVASVTVASAHGGRLVSAAAHVALLAIISFLPRRPAVSSRPSSRLA